MNEEIRKSQVISSVLWKLLERGGNQGIQFIVQIILARLLLPEDYGIIALVIIFISIASAFVDGGLNSALIQKKIVDDVDLSSVFYLSLVVSGLLYTVLYFTAPLVANFYNEPLLAPVIRVLSIILFFAAVNTIQLAVVARKMEFRKLFISSIGAMVVSGTVGIYLAYTGFGVWALVAQQIVNQLIVTTICWFTVKWRPILRFSVERVRSLFSFGWKLLVSSLLTSLYINLQGLIVGKMYNAQMLGYYSRGQQFPSVITNNIGGSIRAVMFPVLSAQQDNHSRVKSLVRRSIVTSSFMIFPMMIGLAVIAEPLVKMLLTDKWLPCVPFMQIFCVFYATSVIQTTNTQAISAVGRSDIFLKLEIIKKVIGLAILGVTVFYGVYAIAVGQVITGFISTVINAYPNRNLIYYSYEEQWNDIRPSLLLSLVMGLVVYSIQWFGMTTLFTLIVQVCTGVILYFMVAWILKLDSFTYVLKSMKEYSQRGL